MRVKMLRNWSENSWHNILPATTRGYSMAKIALYDDPFSEVFQREVISVEGQSLQQKDTKKRKRKGKENKTPKA